MDLFPVEEEIANRIDEAVRLNWPIEDTAEWTRIIKNTSARLGNDRGYSVYASSLDEQVAGGEWLCDLTWSHETARTEQFTLNLACEIEWSTDDEEILWDFQKLTVIVADFRLFVFSHETKDRTEHIVNICKDSCPGSRGFRYLLVGIPEKEPEKLFVEAWTL